MVITKQNIKEILHCRDVYAQKMIDFANGDQEKLKKLIDDKLKEKRRKTRNRRILRSVKNAERKILLIPRRWHRRY